MKYPKILFLSMAVIGLMTGSAFAQASLNAGNTSLAAELISPTVALPLGVINTGYQTGGPIAATTVIRITLSNATFALGPIDIFEPLAATVHGTGTVVALTPNRCDITLTLPLASGTVYVFRNAGIVLGGISIAAGSLAGTLVTLAVDSVTIPGDPNVVASGTVVTVKNQFSATLAPVTSKLNFTTNQESFIPAPAADEPETPTVTESQAGLRIISDETIQNRVVLAGAAPCAWSMPGTISAKITGSLTGLAAVEYEGLATTTYTILAADRTAGNATLLIPAGATDVCKSDDVLPFNNALELTADLVLGTPISPGIRTAQISLGAGGPIPAGYTRTLIAAGATSHDIQLDATQYYIPLVGSDLPSRETFIKIQSKSTIAGSNGVRVAILAADGSITAIYNAGTIVAGTPLLITGQQLKDAAAAAGKTVDGVNGFACIVTVNAPEADVFAYANIIDPFGAKRVPVKSVGGVIKE